MSRAGACYRTASGAPIPNVGELDVQFLTNEVYPAEILFQLADIERPLIAVSDLAKAGNSVEFNEKRRQDHASLRQSDWPRTTWRLFFFFGRGYPLRRRRQIFFSGRRVGDLTSVSSLA